MALTHSCTMSSEWNTELIFLFLWLPKFHFPHFYYVLTFRFLLDSFFLSLISLGVRMLTVSWIEVVDFFSYSSDVPKIKAPPILAEPHAVCQLDSLFLLRTGTQLGTISCFEGILSRRQTPERRKAVFPDISIRVNRNHLQTLPNYASESLAEGQECEASRGTAFSFRSGAPRASPCPGSTTEEDSWLSPRWPFLTYLSSFHRDKKALCRCSLLSPIEAERERVPSGSL